MFRTALLSLGAAALLAPALRAQTAETAAAQPKPAPVLALDFEQDEGGWTALGENARVSLTSVAANVATGKSALRVDYSIGPGSQGVPMLPLEPGKLAGAKSIRMAVKSDTGTTFAVALQEKDGGRYIALVHAPQNQWQRVEIAAADFVLGTGQPDDPKDPNGRLDMDRVEAIGLADFVQFIAQAGNEQLNAVTGIKPGPRVVYVDDFIVGTDALVAAVTPAPERKLDTFAHPQLGWLAVGAVKLSRVNGAPLGMPGLKAEYRQAPQTIAALMRIFTPGSLTGATGVGFTAASAVTVTVIVQVEERGGGKYNTTISIDGGSTAKPVTVQFSQMAAADDSKDTNGKLDPDQIAGILFMDMSGLFGGAEQANTFYVTNLRGLSAP